MFFYKVVKYFERLFKIGLCEQLQAFFARKAGTGEIPHKNAFGFLYEFLIDNRNINIVVGKQFRGIGCFFGVCGACNIFN